MRIKRGDSVKNTTSGTVGIVQGKPYTLPRKGGAEMIAYVDVRITNAAGGYFVRQWRLAGVFPVSGGENGKTR
jgi:hypothetical protein